MVVLLLALCCRKEDGFVEPLDPKGQETVTPTDTTAQTDTLDPPEKEPKTRDDLAWKKVEHFPTVRITVNASDYSRLIAKSASQAKAADAYITGTIRVEDPDGMYSDSVLFEGNMQMRGRGNTTWDMAKKPYRIKLEDHTKLLGMKGNKDWVLLANYSDKSLLRNIVAMEISRLCGMPWTPHMRTVELYINNSYKGSYVLCQHKEVAKEKVDIDVENGDMYLEVDTTQDEKVCFESTRWLVPFMFKDPEEPTAKQVSDFKAYVADIEDSLYVNPGGGWEELIDLDSFVGNYIVQEICKNVDGNFRKSIFFSKTPTGKLVLAHVWDFDIALGNCNYIDSQHQNGVTNGPEGWLIKLVGRKKKADGWYPRLFLDPVFVEAVKEKWDSIKPGLDEIPNMIDRLVDLNRASYDNNFKQWKIIGTYVWPNLYYNFSSYDQEVEYLKEFFTTRVAWLDTELHKL